MVNSCLAAGSFASLCSPVKLFKIKFFSCFSQNSLGERSEAKLPAARQELTITLKIKRENENLEKYSMYCHPRQTYIWLSLKSKLFDRVTHFWLFVDFCCALLKKTEKCIKNFFVSFQSSQFHLRGSSKHLFEYCQKLQNKNIL